MTLRVENAIFQYTKTGFIPGYDSPKRRLCMGGRMREQFMVRKDDSSLRNYEYNLSMISNLLLYQCHRRRIKTEEKA